MKMNPRKFLPLTSMLLLAGCSVTFGGKKSSNESFESASRQRSEESVLSSSNEEKASSFSSSEEERSSSLSSEESSSEEEKKMTIDDCLTTEQINEYKELGYSPLFQDTNFKKGFRVTKTFYGSGESPYHDDEKINFYDLYPSASSYDWTIAQWSSQYDLMKEGGMSLTSDESGLVHTITSQGKTVNGVFVPAKQVICDSKTGGITLTANASVEYEKARISSDPWVHLLFEQGTFKLDGSYVNLSSSKSIVMEADYEVTKCEDMMNGEANANVHAAQLVWYVTLQNLNKSSKGYGKYIWFGLNLFDNRSAGQTTTLYSQYDVGTSTGIYSPSSSLYLDSNNGRIPAIGKRVKAKIDLLSITQKAYEEGKKKGYFDDTEYEDLCLGGMNFGYELPGTYDISSKFYAINIFAK